MLASGRLASAEALRPKGAAAHQPSQSDRQENKRLFLGGTKPESY